MLTTNENIKVDPFDAACPYCGYCNDCPTEDAGEMKCIECEKLFIFVVGATVTWTKEEEIRETEERIRRNDIEDPESAIESVNDLKRMIDEENKK